MIRGKFDTVVLDIDIFVPVDEGGQLGLHLADGYAPSVRTHG